MEYLEAKTKIVDTKILIMMLEDLGQVVIYQ